MNFKAILEKQASLRNDSLESQKLIFIWRKFKTLYQRRKSEDIFLDFSQNFFQKFEFDKKLNHMLKRNKKNLKWSADK